MLWIYLCLWICYLSASVWSQYSSCYSSSCCCSTAMGNTGSNAITCYYVPCYMYYGTPCYVLLVLCIYAIHLLLASYVSVPVSVSGEVLRGLGLSASDGSANGLVYWYSMLCTLCCRDVMHCWCYCYVPLLVLCIYAIHLLLASYVSVPVSVSVSLCLQICYLSATARSHAHAVGVLMLSTMLVVCCSALLLLVLCIYAIHLLLASYVSVTGWSGEVLRGLWICLVILDLLPICQCLVLVLILLLPAMDTHATSSVVLHCSAYRDDTCSMHCTTLLVMLLMVLSVSLAGSHDPTVAVQSSWDLCLASGYPTSHPTAACYCVVILQSTPAVLHAVVDLSGWSTCCLGLSASVWSQYSSYQSSHYFMVTCQYLSGQCIASMHSCIGSWHIPSLLLETCSAYSYSISVLWYFMYTTAARSTVDLHHTTPYLLLVVLAHHAVYVVLLPCES